MPGIQRRLVDRDEQHARIGVEDLVGPVAVVDVPVEDQHPLGAVRVARPPRGDRDVVEEAEAHRLRGLRVVAGRAQRRHAGPRALARAARRRARTPRRRRAAPPRRSPPSRTCRRRSARRRRAHSASIERDVRLGVHGQQRVALGARAPRRARSRTSRARTSRPRARGSAPGARGGPGRRGRGARRGGTRGSGHAGTVGQWPPRRRSRRRGRRGRRALRGPVRRPRGRERHADLRPPARRDRLLLGAGRARRRARRRRLAAAPPRGHARRRPRARAPLRGRGALRGGAGALPRPGARSACASTPTATATSRSGSRAATARAASPTPAAARPAAGSCARSRRSWPSTSGSRCSRAAVPPRLAMDGGAGLLARRRARDRRPRGRAGDGRRRRPVVAHDQPARLVRLRA